MFVAEILQYAAQKMVDILIYGAIALVTVTGIIKCIFPMRRCTRLLRRAVRALENTTHKSGTQSIWQNSLFLGNPMRNAWVRFLKNAEQLDERGLSCDVTAYINDDSVIYANGHIQLAEMVPGLLTSLGILGTFIGLMQGLNGLDVSGAAKTMESISTMINGMTFAFVTSIAGISCSLVFNVIHRSAIGNTTRALDLFHDAFSDLVMQRPLDHNVQMICQQEDRAAFMRHSANELNLRVADGISSAVEHSFMPVSQSIGNFIMGETQAQIEGINKAVSLFIAQLNRSLDGQFLKLGQTLSLINQAQTVSADSIDQTMSATNSIMANMQSVHEIAQLVMDRFEGYIGTLSASQTDSNVLSQQSLSILSQMQGAVKEQIDYMDKLQHNQQLLENNMQEYAAWSGQVLEAVDHQAGTAKLAAHDMAEEMKKGGRMLADSYTSFVENISSGLARTMGMFDENMHGMMQSLTVKLSEIEKTIGVMPGQMNMQSGRLSSEVDGYISALSRMQQAVTDIALMIERTKTVALPLSGGAEACQVQ
jgi:hypothetical protein